MRRLLRPRTRRTGALVPLALAVVTAGLLLGGAAGTSPGAAVDRYGAGQAISVRTALPAAEAARVRSRGTSLARTLGLPAGTGVRVARVVDRFDATTVDELVTTDSRGRRLAILRLQPGGGLATAVRLGWRPASTARIDAAAAVTHATAIAAGTGLAAIGPASTKPTSDGGWRVAWQRTAHGIPVAGDGVSITLFADGSVHAVATRARDLAAAPSSRLGQSTAEQHARRHLERLLGGASGQARIVSSRLAWVAPNDTFDADAPDAPAPVLRLAWVVEARTAAPLADRLRALELFVDAGDGTLLGGDVLR